MSKLFDSEQNQLYVVWRRHDMHVNNMRVIYQRYQVIYIQIERCFCTLQISRNFQRKTTICERCVCNRCKSLVSENRCNQFERPALSRHIFFVDVSHLPFSFFFLKVLGLLFRQSEPKGRTIFNKVLFAVHHGPCFRVFWQFRRPYCVGSFCFFRCLCSVLVVPGLRSSLVFRPTLVPFVL